MTDTPAPNDMPDEPKLPQVNDVINLLGHSWKVYGIHLGAVGVESLIELESLTHRSGWTGEWESHPRVFVPEVFVRHAMNTPADLRAPVAAGGGRDEFFQALMDELDQTNIPNLYAVAAAQKASEVFTALQQPPAPAVDLENILLPLRKEIKAYEDIMNDNRRGDTLREQAGGVYHALCQALHRTADHLAAQGMIKGVE